MGGTAKDLKGQSWIHSTRSLFQKADVLIFSLANSAQRSPEANAEPMLWLLPRIGKASIIQCQFSRGNGKLRIAIQALQSMRREKFSRAPLGNFATAMGVEHRSIERWDARGSTFLGEEPCPKIFDAHPDGGMRGDSGDYRASSRHVARRLSLFSHCAFR